MNIQKGTETRVIFILVDKATKEDGMTGLVGSSANFTTEVSENGNAWAATASDPVEIGQGWYYVTLDATETAIVGPLGFRAIYDDGATVVSDEWRDIHQVTEYSLTTDDFIAIADHVLRRSPANARVSSHGDAPDPTNNFKHSLLGVINTTNGKVQVNGSQLDHYQEDGATVEFSLPLNTGTDPLTITGKG